MCRQIALADAGPIGGLQDFVDLSNREELGNYTETDVVGDSATTWQGRNRSRHSRGLRSLEQNSMEMF